jgi:hypothetical protein
VLLSLPFFVHATRSLEHRAASGAPALRRHANGDVSGIVVRMTRGGSVSGRLVDADGAPVVGARVVSRRHDYGEACAAAAFHCGWPSEATVRETRSDAAGRFELALLRPTDYALVIDHPAFPRHALHDLRVLADLELDLGDVLLPRGGALVGTLRTADGAPIAGGHVRIEEQGRGVHHHHVATTEPDGSFRIDGIHPGRYRVGFGRPTEQPAVVYPQHGEPPPERITIHDEQTLTHDGIWEE